jgi:hypothetical protein
LILPYPQEFLESLHASSRSRRLQRVPPRAAARLRSMDCANQGGIKAFIYLRDVNIDCAINQIVTADEIRLVMACAPGDRAIVCAYGSCLPRTV